MVRKTATAMSTAPERAMENLAAQSIVGSSLCRIRALLLQYRRDCRVDNVDCACVMPCHRARGGTCSDDD